MILAGDIGGTKCNLAVFQEHGSSLRLVFKRRYVTNEFSGLEALIETFFRECLLETGAAAEGNISAAGFGIAGAMVDDRLVSNNISWELTASSLARKLGLQLEQLTLINDLVATAYGLVHLTAQDFLVLNPGMPQINGNQALIAAGTGLGQAMIFWDGCQHRASPSEGGAADFAPRTEREIQLLRFLKTRLDRVSCEEIFSGRGFRKLHEFINPSVVHPTFVEPEGASASEITQNALAGTCPVCVEVLESGAARSRVWRRLFCRWNRSENIIETAGRQLLQVLCGQRPPKFRACEHSHLHCFERRRAALGSRASSARQCADEPPRAT